MYHLLNRAYLNNELINMDETRIHFTMVLAGVITLHLIFLLFSFIIARAIKLRISASSIIASLVLTWLTMFCVVGFFPATTSNNWIVAIFMLTLVGIYLGWLKIFEPKSLDEMLRSSLKEKELSRVDAVKTQLNQDLAKCGKGAAFDEKRKEIKLALKANKIERNLIIKSHRRPPFYSRILTMFKKRNPTSGAK